MEYRLLGASGIRVSVIGLGTANFGGTDRLGGLDVPRAQALLDRALDAGVNFVDTADAYSAGESETIVGQVIRGRRTRIVLATKVRFSRTDGPNDAGLSRHHIIESCDASLRRLGVDHVDLYQMHGWDGTTPIEETSEALSTLVGQGKVRYVGCSNYSAWHLMKSLAAADRQGRPRFVSHQIYYSLIGREAEHELIPASIDQGVGVLVWSPLAAGLLTGKHRQWQSWTEGSRWAKGWNEPPIRDWGYVWSVVEELVRVADARGASPAQVALAYLIGKPGVTGVIVGARTIEQLTDNLGARGIELTDDERSRLDTVSARPLPYPFWHQARNAIDRASPADLTLLRQFIDPPVDDRNAHG